jgi:hypothetical protein
MLLLQQSPAYLAHSAYCLETKLTVLLLLLLLSAHRNVPGFPYDRHYETNGWFYVDDAVTNLMKNRYVITMPLMGMPVSAGYWNEKLAC